jgi:uncharacterized protein (TIGR02118 family)
VVKFVVVLYKKPSLSAAEFAAYMRNVHGPLARRLPGLRRYVQNSVVDDGKRAHPGWDGMVELYFDDRAALEAAWESQAGQASDSDLPNFLDLARTSWSIVDEVVVF